MGQRTMSDRPADQAAQIGNYQQGIPAMQQPKGWLFPSGPASIMLKLAQSSSYPQGLLSASVQPTTVLLTLPT